MADTPAQRKAKRAWEMRQRELDPDGFKLRQREAQKRYHERHKERLAAKRKATREANLEAERARGRADYAANRERRIAAAQAWKDRNPEQMREYRRHYNLRKYGLTVEQRDQMFADQGYVCAACGSDNPRGKAGWQVDHCHATGNVRGVVCIYCNVALGKVQDSEEHLLKLIKYLRRTNGHHVHSSPDVCPVHEERWVRSHDRRAGGLREDDSVHFRVAAPGV